MNWELLISEFVIIILIITNLAKTMPYKNYLTIYIFIS
jgi:hypothetical protein